MSNGDEPRLHRVHPVLYAPFIFLGEVVSARQKKTVKKKGNAMVKVGREVSFPMLHIADAYGRASFDRSSALMARHTAGAKCNRSISLKHNGSISR